MKKICKLLAMIIDEMFHGIAYFIKSNLRNFAKILAIILPYAMYFIGQYVAIGNDKISIGMEIFVPVVFLVVCFFLKSMANKLGKGTTIPIPDKRFTDVDDDGEVSIENNRIQELILYLADLEDWLERKGLM